MTPRALTSQTALVTGASGGIGADLARELAALGAHLVITARSKDKLEALAAELRARHGVEVHVFALDLCARGGAAELAAAVDGAGLTIDVLVNNAGFATWAAFADTRWDDIERLIDLDLRALTFLTHHFVGGMKARGRGHIMNVASFLAFAPCPNLAVYAAAKGYVLSLTEALDYELKKTGVRAFATCPGGTRTGFSEAAGQRLKKVGERSLMTSASVARLSVKKMLRGRRTYIPGWMNVVSGWVLRLVPRTFRPGFMKAAMGAGVEAPKV
ncbi:MAG: SDR family oxidoreductase [Myxococcota bacterium]